MSNEIELVDFTQYALLCDMVEKMQKEDFYEFATYNRIDKNQNTIGNHIWDRFEAQEKKNACQLIQSFSTDTKVFCFMILKYSRMGWPAWQRPYKRGNVCFAALIVHNLFYSIQTGISGAVLNEKWGMPKELTDKFSKDKHIVDLFLELNHEMKEQFFVQSKIHFGERTFNCN
jgi:hypothetical protein